MKAEDQREREAARLKAREVVEAEEAELEVEDEENETSDEMTTVTVVPEMSAKVTAEEVVIAVTVVPEPTLTTVNTDAIEETVDAADKVETEATTTIEMMREVTTMPQPKAEETEVEERAVAIVNAEKKTRETIEPMVTVTPVEDHMMMVLVVAEETETVEPEKKEDEEKVAEEELLTETTMETEMTMVANQDDKAEVVDKETEVMVQTTMESDQDVTVVAVEDAPQLKEKKLPERDERRWSATTADEEVTELLTAQAHEERPREKALEVEVPEEAAEVEEEPETTLERLQDKNEQSELTLRQHEPKKR